MKVLAIAALALACVTAQAELIDRGGGLIYDSWSGITWMSEANPEPMTFAQAQQWVDALEYGGYTDWRLPRYYGFGGRICEVNCVVAAVISEPTHLLYYGTPAEPGFYWGVTSKTDSSPLVWDEHGVWWEAFDDDVLPVWAVRDGDVAGIEGRVYDPVLQRLLFPSAPPEQPQDETPPPPVVTEGPLPVPVSPVPEPSTWALMLVGLAVVARHAAHRPQKARATAH